MTITWSLVAKIMSAQTDRDCHEGCGCERAHLPLLKEPASKFETVTTHGPIKLSDYGGKWLVLCSHRSTLHRPTPSPSPLPRSTPG